MASLWTPTHPRNAYQPSSMTLGSFQSALRSALVNSRSKARPSYRSVRVLLMFWHHTCHSTCAEDQDYTTSELVFQLAKVLRESYRYFFQIQYLGCRCQSSPSRSPRRAADHLSPDNEIVENDSLVIIYYIGYGRVLNSHLYICSSEERRQKDINFTRDVASGFASSDSDADSLLLLDCHTDGGVFNNSSIIPDTGAGTIHEVIASTAPDTDNWSFTRHLIRELQHAAETKEILTTPQLYARLAAASLYPQASPESCPGNPPTNPRSLPIHLHNLYHTQTHPRTSTATVHLAPLKPNRPRRPPPTPLLPPGSNGILYEHATLSKPWTAAPSPHLLQSPVTILLSVNIQSTMRGQSQEQDHFAIQKSLQDWAYNHSHSQSQSQSQPQTRSPPPPHEEEIPAPIDSVDRIRIHTSYQSSSSSSPSSSVSTILFKVPPDVWDTLPPNPAMHFLTVTTKPVIPSTGQQQHQQQQQQQEKDDSVLPHHPHQHQQTHHPKRSRRSSRPPSSPRSSTSTSPSSSSPAPSPPSSSSRASASATSQEDNLSPGPKESPDEEGSSNNLNRATLPEQAAKSKSKSKSKSRPKHKSKRIPWTTLVSEFKDSSSSSTLKNSSIIRPFPARETKRPFPNNAPKKGKYTRLKTPASSPK